MTVDDAGEKQVWGKNVLQCYHSNRGFHISAPFNYPKKFFFEETP